MQKVVCYQWEPWAQQCTKTMHSNLLHPNRETLALAMCAFSVFLDPFSKAGQKRKGKLLFARDFDRWWFSCNSTFSHCTWGYFSLSLLSQMLWSVNFFNYSLHMITGSAKCPLLCVRLLTVSARFERPRLWPSIEAICISTVFHRQTTST